MKIEYLAAGSRDCPLIRVCGTNASGFATLQGAAQHLARRDGTRIAAHDLPGFQSVAGCALEMVSARRTGVRDLGGDRFVWELAPADWLTVAELIEPFARGSLGGHQWLAGREASYGLDGGPIAIVISATPDGTW